MVQPTAHFIDPQFKRISGASAVIGVCSFSKNGIASVQVTVSDGVNTDVVETATTMSWNTEEADWVWCYNVEVDATSLDDGPLTVTALCTDEDSNTRSISQTLNNNSAGSLPEDEAWVDSTSGDDGTGEVNNVALPFATIMGAASALGNTGGRTRDPGGCTIYLEAGDHTYGTYSYGLRIEDQSADWLKITNAAGTSADEVKITATATEGIRGYYIWFDGITIEVSSSMGVGPRNSTTGTRYLRASNLIVSDADYVSQINDVACFSTGWDAQYYQNCLVSGMRNGWGGSLVRGITYTKIGEDVFPNGPCAINIVCLETDRGTETGWHPDGVQFFSINENILVYNFKILNGKCQLLFQGDSLTAVKDVAIINFLGRDNASGFSSQFLSGFDHLMIWNSHVDQTLRFDETEGTLTDLDLRNSYVGSLVATGGNMATLEAAGTIDSISQGDDGGHGTNPVDGSGIAFEDSANNDYVLTSASDGYESGTTIPMAFPTGSRGPRNATTPDIGPWLDTASVPAVGEEENSYLESVLLDTPVVTASAVNTTVTVTWSAIEGAATYRTERSDNGGASWSTVETGADTTTVDTELAEGTYVYRVFAIDSGASESLPGESSSVEVVPITTTAFRKGF
jgi:hypothetical protein